VLYHTLYGRVLPKKALFDTATELGWLVSFSKSMCPSYLILASMPLVSHRLVSSFPVVPWFVLATPSIPPHGVLLSDILIAYTVISTLCQLFAIFSVGSWIYILGTGPDILNKPFPSTLNVASP